MKKILITGSNGLLGQKIIKELQEAHPKTKIIAVSKGENRLTELTGFDYYNVDISEKIEIQTLIDKELPNVIINSAAITNVDICETEKEMCWRVNVDAVRYISESCEKNNIHLIQLSTDFIFDGKNGPYSEEDEANPLSYYGESKLASEEIVKQLKCHWSIVRTVLVYGVGEALGRSNIVLWAIEALRKNEVLNVVTDQKRTPTLAEDLAIGCLQIAFKRRTGVYNLSGSDFLSIDKLVEQIAKVFGFSNEKINKISSETLSQAAKRPPLTGFVITKAKNDFNYSPHTFEAGLELVKKQLNK